MAGNRRRLICKAFGTTGAVNIVLNWHDMKHVGLHFHLETLPLPQRGTASDCGREKR